MQSLNDCGSYRQQVQQELNIFRIESGERVEFSSITITAWFNGRFMDDGTDGDDEDEDVVVDEHGV